MRIDQVSKPGSREKHPLWLLLSVSAPVGLILMIFTSLYARIHSLFEAEKKTLWLGLGVFLLVYVLGITALAVISWIRKKEIFAMWGLPVLIINLGFLIFAVVAFEDIIPRNVPLWMYMGDNQVIYLIAMMMPGFAYGAARLILYFTPHDRKPSIPLNLGLAVGIPLFWLLVLKVIIPWINKNIRGNEFLYSEFWDILMIIILTASTVLFLFFIIRMFILIHRQHPKFFTQIMKIPIVLVFPLLGLLLNNGVFNILAFSKPVFGDFSHPVYYLVAIATGVVLILPPKDDPLYTRVLLLIKLFFVPYTLYFFVIFLPWLPLSIPAILFFGTGLLLLAPTGLLIYHAWSIIEDIKRLGPEWRQWPRVLMLLGISLVIPLMMIVNMYRDKAVLYKALDHIYQPDYSKKDSGKIPARRIAKALYRSEKNEVRNIWDFGFSTPIITPLFNRIVFGYQALSHSKRSLLAGIYMGHQYRSLPVTPAITTPAGFMDITELVKDSHYDQDRKVWKTRLKIKIKNYTSRQMEYNHTMKLDEGAYVSDFKLRIGDTLKRGLLSEKKAALWVYDQITRPRTLDPAILYTLNDAEMQLRVFPFSAKETRYLEIEITHLRPFDLRLGTRHINLGDEAINIYARSENDTRYVSQKDHARLQAVQRPLKYYFAVNASQSYTNNIGLCIPAIQKFIKDRSLKPEQFEVLVVNQGIRYLDTRKDWVGELRGTKQAGGFYAGLAIRQILVNNYLNASTNAPVIILVSADQGDAIYTHDLEQYALYSPDLAGFYHLDHLGNLSLSEWDDFQHSRDAVNIHSYPVKMWPSSAHPRVFLPYTYRHDQIITDPGNLTPGYRKQLLEDSYTEQDQETLFKMAAIESLQKLMPDDRIIDKLIYTSFATGLMNSRTSWIVVENEAQEQGLKEKQKRVLKGKYELDADTEEPRQMSEPGLWILIILAGGIFILYHRRKRPILLKN